MILSLLAAVSFEHRYCTWLSLHNGPGIGRKNWVCIKNLNLFKNTGIEKQRNNNNNKNK